MSTTIDTRFCDGGIELRSNGRASPKIIGYAAVFNSFSEDLGGFKEIIRPGTFADAISSGQDVRALMNHDSNLVLGRTKSGTLRLSEDRRGLRYEIDPPDTTTAKDLIASLKRGDISGSSFSFMTVSDLWRSENGQQIRELHKVNLFDVGPVTYPAYPATVSEATKRSLQLRGGSAATSFEAEPDVLDVTIWGRALPFYTDSIAMREAGGGFTESVGPWAILRPNGPIPLLFDHCEHDRAGTAKLVIAEDAVYFTAELFANGAGRRALEGIRDMSIRRCSVGFDNYRAVDRYPDGAWPHRCVRQAGIREISLCTDRSDGAVAAYRTVVSEMCDLTPFPIVTPYRGEL